MAIPALALGGKPAHPERMDQFMELTKMPGLLWEQTLLNRFRTEAPGASASLCGVKGDWKKDIQEAVARGDVARFEDSDAHAMLANVEMPDAFDSAENWPKCAKMINDIRDQSNCGCCWAFAGVEAASDRMCIASKASLVLPISAQDVCFGANEDGCGGGQITTPWDYIKNTGAVTGGQFKGTGAFGKGFCQDFSLPHCHHHGPQGNDPYPAEGKPGCPSEDSPRHSKSCDSAAASPHADFSGDQYTFSGQVETASGVKAIQKMIMAGGPVETAFTVYTDFENYAGGVYHHVTGDVAGGHAVKIVGWGVDSGTKYWKVANSWNPHWGEEGYFRIKFGDCGIDDQVVGSSADSTWQKKGDGRLEVTFFLPK